MSEGGIPRDELDIPENDLRSFAYHSNPYPLYRIMHQQAPTQYSPDNSSWRITRHADIIAVLRDERFGFPAPAPTLPPWREMIGDPQGPHNQLGLPPHAQPFYWLKLQEKVFEMRQHWILLLNPPAQTRLRGLVMPHFQLAAVARWQPFIQQTADALIDMLLDRGAMDLIHDFAGPLTSWVMVQVLGVPPQDRHRLEQWSHELGHFLHADMHRTSMKNFYRMGVAGINLTEYFRKWIETRQSPYGDDVVAALMRDHGSHKLSEDELLAMCVLLLLGGYGTTRNLIGNGMLALLHHPDQWRLLQRQPELVSPAVEECLRYETPGQTAGRVAFDEVSLNGSKINKGDWMNLMLGAGNWDPDPFPEPERFDITRSPNPHLGFGYGIHYCVGAHLARAIARTAVGTLARRLPQLALRDTLPEWATDHHQRALKALPVVF